MSCLFSYEFPWFSHIPTKMYHASLFFVILVFSLWYSKVSYSRRKEFTFPRSLVFVSQGEHYYNQSVVLYTKKSKKYTKYTCGDSKPKMKRQDRKCVINS